MALTSWLDSRMRTPLFIVLVVVFSAAIYLRLNPHLELKGKVIQITALLYTGMPNDPLTKRNVAMIRCRDKKCLGPVVSQILEDEFQRYSGARTRIVFRAVEPIHHQLIEIHQPANSFEGLALSYQLFKEFGARDEPFFRSSIRLFMNVIPKPEREYVERSLGSAVGRIGYIEWHTSRNAEDYLWNITKTLHEIGHTLGAKDKYAIDHRSVFPDGYVEPHLGEGNTQKYVEIMSGTRPVKGRREAQAYHYRELRFGKASAREMGWL